MSGLFDLPAPVLGALDAWLAPFAGDGLRLLGWAAAGGASSIALHAWAADRRALDAVRAALRATHRALAAYDGDPNGLRALASEAMRLSARQLRLNLRPAIVAALPLMFLLPWISNQFGMARPAAGESVMVCVEPIEAASTIRGDCVATGPASAAGCLQIAWPAGSATLEDAQARTLARLPAASVSGVVHPPSAWDWLVANPAGTLPMDSPVRRLSLALRPREHFSVGPAWLRGWEAAFAAGALLGAAAAAAARAARLRASRQVE
ncbi:MAG: hypothetical protein ACK558_15270 [Pseudomonadota bacterium]